MRIKIIIDDDHMKVTKKNGSQEFSVNTGAMTDMVKFLSEEISGRDGFGYAKCK